jgi:signal transduction histidine kinase
MARNERKILVVDDNIEFVNYIRRALNHEDYKISIALDGKTAIEKVATEKPELVLLDLKLPDLSGEEILERIKGQDKDIAVVVITGYGGDQVAIDLMRRGAVDFLSKPVEREILIRAIKNALAIHDARQENKQFNPYPSLEIFFPFLAHEIRNPLHAIAGALAIIQKRSNLEDQYLSQSIKIISEEVDHLNDFVQECLNFVRPPNIVRITEINLGEVISAVASVISHIFPFESKKIKITVRIDPDLPKVYANYEEIKQAFLNIIKNGFEAMPDGGELAIEAFRSPQSPGKIEILFHDQGIGMKKEVLQSLFNPFFTTKPRGNGLGLALCRRIIVERHQGKIHIESVEKKGTTVKVELPVSRHPQEASGEA